MKKKLLVFKKTKDRDKVLDILAKYKVKIIHDSCGRVINLDASKLTKEVLCELPKETKVVSLNENIKSHLEKLESGETRFLNALSIRLSSEFKENRKKRKPFGMEPEEKELFTGSCLVEE